MKLGRRNNEHWSQISRRKEGIREEKEKNIAKYWLWRIRERTKNIEKSTKIKETQTETKNSGSIGDDNHGQNIISSVKTKINKKQPPPNSIKNSLSRSTRSITKNDKENDHFTANREINLKKFKFQLIEYHC